MSRILYQPLPNSVLCLVSLREFQHVANNNKADRDGKKCYLNTAQYEPNVAIYERLGFKVGKFAEVKVEDDSIEVYPDKTSLIVGIRYVSGATACAVVKGKEDRRFL